MKEYIIITGTNRGLGLSILNELTKVNTFAKIFCLNRTLNDNIFDPRIVQININLENEDKLEKLLLDKIWNNIPKNSFVTIINNSATIEPIDLVINLNINSYLSTFKVNALAGCIICSSTINELYIKGKIRILNITSGAANRPIKGWGLYCASKAYVKMFLDVMKLEFPKIDLIHFDPGTMDTKMQETIRQTSSAALNFESFVALKERKQLKNTSEVSKQIINILFENSNPI